MNFTKDFLDYAQYNCVAFLFFNLNLMTEIDPLLDDGIKIDYIISSDNNVIPPSSHRGIPIFNASHLTKLKIDLLLVSEGYVDSAYFNAIVKPFNIDLIDIKTLYYFNTLFKDTLPTINTLLHTTKTKLILLLAVTTYRLSQLSEREKVLQTTGNIFVESTQVYNPKEAFDDLDVTDEYIKNLFLASLNWERKFQSLSNYSDEYCNVIEGNRFVPDVPDSYDNTIYTFGGCTSRGILAEDKNTTAAFLQKNLNHLAQINKNTALPTKSYRVINVWNTITLENFSSWLNTINYKQDDMFFYLLDYNRMFSKKLYAYINKKVFEENFSNIIFYDTFEDFNNLKNSVGEFFVDNLHYSHKGYKATADRLSDIIWNLPTDNESIVEQEQAIHKKTTNSFIDNLEKDETLQAYLKNLNKLREDNIAAKNIGAVVVNCNPFTNGHKYLIEKASEMVDFLYIFVVEENKSFFSFDDRKNLVEKGTSHLKNVQVLPSGHFIISSFTFPGYFTKEEIAPEIDSSFDVEIFGKYVCPALNITTRFVGTEPNCQITKAYNSSMKEILPFYNVELIELERFEYNELPISATSVRKLLEEKQFHEIQKIVPTTTYTFLLEKFQA